MMADKTAKDLVRIGKTGGGNAMTPAQFGALAEMPAELEWLVNITNPQTRLAYRIDIADFMRIPRKLSALTALFDYLRERNAVAGNPVDG
jgi:hypothetical protein